MKNVLRSLARRLFRTGYYWEVSNPQTSEQTIQAYRRRGMKIGNRVAIYSSTFDALYPELITIGDDVTITLATILVHDDAPVLFCGKRLVSPVTIGNRVFIGARSVILAGVNIGNDCILAAGSVATKNIPSGGVYAGNPARFIRSIEDYRLKITNDPNLLPVQLKSNLTDGDEETAMREAVASRWGK